MQFVFFLLLWFRVCYYYVFSVWSSYHSMIQLQNDESPNLMKSKWIWSFERWTWFYLIRQWSTINDHTYTTYLCWWNIISDSPLNYRSHTIIMWFCVYYTGGLCVCVHCSVSLSSSIYFNINSTQYFIWFFWSSNAYTICRTLRRIFFLKNCRSHVWFEVPDVEWI